MASLPGVQRAVSSSRGAPSPVPFPAATNFPSRAAALFLRQHHLPGESGSDDAVEEIDEDDDGMDDDDEEEAELVDEAACSSQQRCASSPGIGRVVMNGQNRVRQIQEEQQWQHSHEPYIQLWNRAIWACFV